MTIVSINDGAAVNDSHLTIEAAISDEGGGIGRIEWRVNGVTLGIDTRGLVRTDQASAPADKRKTVRERLALVPGENLVEVVAYNWHGPDRFTAGALNHA